MVTHVWSTYGDILLTVKNPAIAPGTPMRLVPNEVTTPRQSGPNGSCPTLRAIRVFCKMVVAPLTLRRALPG